MRRWASAAHLEGTFYNREQKAALCRTSNIMTSIKRTRKRALILVPRQIRANNCLTADKHKNNRGCASVCWLGYKKRGRKSLSSPQPPLQEGQRTAGRAPPFLFSHTSIHLPWQLAFLSVYFLCVYKAARPLHNHYQDSSLPTLFVETLPNSSVHSAQSPHRRITYHFRLTPCSLQWLH